MPVEHGKLIAFVVMANLDKWPRSGKELEDIGLSRQNISGIRRGKHTRRLNPNTRQALHRMGIPAELTNLDNLTEPAVLEYLRYTLGRSMEDVRRYEGDIGAEFSDPDKEQVFGDDADPDSLDGFRERARHDPGVMKSLKDFVTKYDPAMHYLRIVEHVMASVRVNWFPHQVGMEEHSTISTPQSASSLRRLEAELAAIHNALRWGIAWQPEKVARLGGALARLWDHCGKLPEGLRLLKEVLGCESRLEPRTLAHAHKAAGEMAMRLMNYHRARRHLQRSLSLYDELGDASEKAEVLQSLGDLMRNQGRYPKARAYLEESRVLYRKCGNKWSEAVAINLLACIARNLARNPDELDEARQLFKESRTCYESLRNLQGIAWNEHDQAELLHLQGRHPDRELYGPSFARFDEQKDPFGTAWSRFNQAYQAYQNHEFTKARDWCGESLVSFSSWGAKDGMGACFSTGAQIAMRDDPKRAALLYGVAEAMRKAIHVPVPAQPVYRLQFEDFDRGGLAALRRESWFESVADDGRSMHWKDAMALL